MALVLDLGQQALAGGFLTQAQSGSEERYPLRLSFCQQCFLLQVVDVVPPAKLFSQYFYSNLGKLRADFPEWDITISLPDMIEQMVRAEHDRAAAGTAS